MTEQVRVDIFGQSYNLRSHHGGEHIERIARLVDERMRHISSQMTTHDTVKIAVLAALNIADELQSLKDHHEREAQVSLAQPPVEPQENEGAERAEERSWFDDIFDSSSPSGEVGERLSSRVSAKLQLLRQASQETITLQEEGEAGG